METARGRWFLAEYAKRNRSADTTRVLEALSKLEELGAPTESAQPIAANSAVQIAVAKVRETPWHGAPDPAGKPLFERPLQGAKSATSAIRSTSEKIREVAFELREAGKLDIYADALELYCTDLAHAVQLQESSVARLSEVAALVNAMEAGLDATIGAKPSQHAPPVRKAEAEAPAVSPRVSDSPSVAPIAAPRLDPTSAVSGETQTTDGRSGTTVPTATGGSSVLMFVRPN